MALWISLVAVFICLGVVVIGVSRGFQVKQLLEDGVEGTGTVIRQGRRNAKRSRSTDHFLRYEYQDAAGRRHEGKMHAQRDFWAAHPEGAPIEIFYSASKPAVSAARFLVEQARAARKKA